MTVVAILQRSYAYQMLLRCCLHTENGWATVGAGKGGSRFVDRTVNLVGAKVAACCDCWTMARWWEVTAVIVQFVWAHLCHRRRSETRWTCCCRVATPGLGRGVLCWGQSWGHTRGAVVVAMQGDAAGEATMAGAFGGARAKVVVEAREMLQLHVSSK